MSGLARKWLPHPFLSLTLALVWLLLNNSFDPGHVVLGLLLGFFIPLLTSAFWPEAIRIQRPLVLLRFVGVVLMDIVIANVVVAKLILGRNDSLQPAFMRIELDLTSDVAKSILSNTISLTPGTVSSDLSEDRRTLLVHSLHVEDIEAEVARIKQRYEQPLKEVFV